MTKTEQVQEIFSKLEDNVSDLNEKAAIYVSEASDKVLKIIGSLEIKYDMIPKIIDEIYKTDETDFMNIITHAIVVHAFSEDDNNENK